MCQIKFLQIYCLTYAALRNSKIKILLLNMLKIPDFPGFLCQSCQFEVFPCFYMFLGKLETLYKVLLNKLL